MAFSSVSMTSFDAKLKQWYIERKKLYLMDSYGTKLLQAIEKKTDGGGKGWNVAVGASSIVGGAGTYGSSWQNATAGVDVNFNGPWKRRFGHGFIDDQVIRSSKNSNGAIEPALEEKLNQVRDQFNQGTNFQLYRSEFGELGVVSSFVAGGVGGTVTVTANSAPGIQRVRPGMILDFAANIGTGNLRTTTWKVTGQNDNSTITIAPVGSSGSDVPVAGDTFCIDGDNGVAGSAVAANALAGLASWVPSSAPGTGGVAGTFKTVDRTQDTRALGGIRVDATGMRIIEAYTRAGDQTMQYGAKTATIFCHPTNYSALKANMQSMGIYAMASGDAGFVKGKPMVKGMSKGDLAKFGFKAMALDGQDRPILVVPDAFCPIALSYAIESESCWLETVDPWPSLRDLDGGPKMLRLTDGVNNSYVNELVGYGEFLVSAPGHQCVIIHNTAA